MADLAVEVADDAVGKELSWMLFFSFSSDGDAT